MYENETKSWSASSNMVPAKTPEIQVLQDVIFKELEALSMELEGLTARLDSVMRPSNPSPEARKDLVKQAGSKLAEAMQRMANILALTTGRIIEIKDRLDI